MEQKLEQHNTQSFHYDFVGFTNLKKVYDTLSEVLHYYRIERGARRYSKEVFYDVPSQLLAEAGIAISKWIEGGKASLNIRRIFSIKELNKPSQKFLFGYCNNDEQPKDYSYQMAAMIESSFKTPFSVDLESIIKQTQQTMVIEMVSDRYNIICGTGYRAIMQYEVVVYRNAITGKKVERSEVTFKFPIEDRPEKREILDAIDRYVKGLALSKESRFEIARKILFPQSQETVDNDNPQDNDEGQK